MCCWSFISCDRSVIKKILRIMMALFLSEGRYGSVCGVCNMVKISWFALHREEAM